MIHHFQITAFMSWCTRARQTSAANGVQHTVFKSIHYIFTGFSAKISVLLASSTKITEENKKLERHAEGLRINTLQEMITPNTSNVFCLYPHEFLSARGEEFFYFFIFFTPVPPWEYSQTTNKLRLVQYIKEKNWLCALRYTPNIVFLFISASSTWAFVLGM